MKTFIQIPVWFPTLKISGRAKDVLLVLLAYDYRADGWMWPGQGKIAKFLGTDRAIVTRAINELEAERILRRLKRQGQSTGYQIDPDFLERLLGGAQTPRPARSRSKAQRELLLPITGDKTSPPDPGAGDISSPVEPGKTGLKKSPTGDVLSREVRKKDILNPSPTTESACRAREEIKNSAGQLRRASRAQGGIADPAQRKEARRQMVWRYVQATKSGKELAAFTADQLADAERAQTSLDHYDRLMRAAGWDDRRQAGGR